MPIWPLWWDWELALTPHVERRMLDRGLDESQLRAMLRSARAWHPVEVTGRYAIVAVHRKSEWRIIVEPDAEERALVVVTAFRVESP
jgi:hypothetical protein